MVRFPTRYEPFVPADPPTRPSVRPTAERRVRVSRHCKGQVTVLKVAGRLTAVVEDLDHALELALAEEPRGVVCDLSEVLLTDTRLQARDVAAVQRLATAGRHVRDWPGIPVALACPDARVREAVHRDPLGRHLIVIGSLFSAITSVVATPTLPVKRLRLAAHPTAPKASRKFVERTLVDWQLGDVAPFAKLLVSELVASSTINAGTDVEVALARDGDAVRLSVRDHGPALPGQQPGPFDPSGQQLGVVSGLSRTFGALPTADGGRVLWAVLDAPRSRASTNRDRLGSNAEPAQLLRSIPLLPGGNS